MVQFAEAICNLGGSVGDQKRCVASDCEAAPHMGKGQRLHFHVIGITLMCLFLDPNFWASKFSKESCILIFFLFFYAN